MRFWFALLVLLLITAPIAAQDTLTYTFKSGTQVTYPAGWELEETEDADFIFIYNDIIDILLADPPALRTLGIRSSDPTKALEQYFYPYDTSLEFDPNQIILADIGDRQTARYSFEDTYEDTSFTNMLIAISFSDGAVGIVDVSYWGNAQLLQPVVMKIVGSFDRPPLSAATALPPLNPTQISNYTPGFQADDCPFAIPGSLVEGESLDCGWLTVPENRSDPQTKLIRLAVAIVRSTSATPEPDPLIYLEGGPGGSPLVTLDSWIDSPFRAKRDIILIDQRGTGYSQPTLDCATEDPDEDEPACFARLVAAGIDLTAYNSAANAADIHDLVLALGYEEVNLYGISYGTRLALTLMRDFPRGLRSVVLDSVYPPEVNALDEQVLTFSRAIQRLFEQCTLDQACAAAYGDIGAKFLRLVDKLNNQPVSYTDYDGSEVELYGDDLVDILGQTLYITAAIPTLPYGIYLLDMGDYTVGMDVLNGYYSLTDLQTLAAGEDLPPFEEFSDEDTLPDGDSTGMFNTVECYEEVHFNSLGAAYTLSANLPSQLRESQLLSVESMFDTCSLWGVAISSELETQAVISDIPTLILSGSFDPVTPPAWGRLAAEHLSHSFFYEFPHGGHSLLDSGDCAVSIGLAFIDDPTSAPESTCIDTIQVEFFILEPCLITAVDRVDLRYGAGTAYNIQRQLPAGATETADVSALDSEGYYWFHLLDGGWLRNDAADLSLSCNLVPDNAVPETS